MKTIGAPHIQLWLKWLDEAISDLEGIRTSGDTISAPNHMRIMRAFANSKALRESIRDAAITDIQVRDAA